MAVIVDGIEIVSGMEHTGGAGPVVTEKMIQAACVAGYGVDSDKDSNLYKLMKRALAAGLAARKD